MSNAPGHFFVIAAPSGTGKTSLVRALVNNINDLKISISYTTRSPRPGDVEGKDYHFVANEVFEEMLENSNFFRACYDLPSSIWYFTVLGSRAIGSGD